jgi:hypothetical protein
MKLENVPREALDELLDLIEIAEDKSKIALVDLLKQTLHTCFISTGKSWKSVSVDISNALIFLTLKLKLFKTIILVH